MKQQVRHYRHHSGRPHAEPGSTWRSVTGNGKSTELQGFFAGFTAFRETPLLELGQLASAAGVARVSVKDESGRMNLGAFKALGGIYAVACALGRHWGVAPGELPAGAPAGAERPTVVCASAGNHGLAVAEGARLLGVNAKILVHDGVSAERRERISARGATLHEVPGTYDDAVRLAGELAGRPGYLLVADTSADPLDAGVLDVMRGYTLLAAEMTSQLAGLARRIPTPTHLFLQAGVGGVAAALAGSLGPGLAPDGRVVVVEPAEADCVLRSLQAGRPTAATGSLLTSMSMLACGEPSLPALDVLQRVATDALAISDAAAASAVKHLAAAGGPRSTPSGAAGLAGFLAAAADPECRAALNLTADSVVLCVITEGTA
jgi:diaminopropionate ammonia-lyase